MGKNKSQRGSIFLAVAVAALSYQAESAAATRVFTEGVKCTSKDGSETLLEYGVLREIAADHGHAMNRGPYVYFGGNVLSDLQKNNVYPTKNKAQDDKLAIGYSAAKRVENRYYEASVRNDKGTVFLYSMALGKGGRVSLSVKSADGSETIFEDAIDNCRAKNSVRAIR